MFDSNEKKGGEEGLRRLDSVHLNKLTSLAFNKKDSSKTKKEETVEEICEEDSDEELISPLGKFKDMNLEAIDEIDSFCTDSSYVPSPDMIRSPLGKLN